LKTLDSFMPTYEFSERHRVRVNAPRERVDAAIRSVSLDDIAVARALWWLRRMGRGQGMQGVPFVQGALKNARVLDDREGEGIVLGLRGDFWKPRGGGGGDSCEAVLEFRIEPPYLSTETRVHVADPAARRKFRRYWRVIRPFSGLIRILMLRAAKKRAEVAA
jgi:hypothetical protein